MSGRGLLTLLAVNRRMCRFLSLHLMAAFMEQLNHPSPCSLLFQLASSLPHPCSSPCFFIIRSLKRQECFLKSLEHNKYQEQCSPSSQECKSSEAYTSPLMGVPCLSFPTCRSYRFELEMGVWGSGHLHSGNSITQALVPSFELVWPLP